MAARKTEQSKPSFTVVDGVDHPGTSTDDQVRDDAVVLDEFEQLAADTILDDEDGDEPGAPEEIHTIQAVKSLPKFANFRSNPESVFDLWGRATGRDWRTWNLQQFAPKTMSTFAASGSLKRQPPTKLCDWSTAFCQIKAAGSPTRGQRANSKRWTCRCRDGRQRVHG